MTEGPPKNFIKKDDIYRGNRIFPDHETFVYAFRYFKGDIP